MTVANEAIVTPKSEAVLSIVEPVPHSVTHSQPRVRWHALAEIPTDARLRAQVRETTTGAKWAIESPNDGDFFIPVSLDKGRYQLRLTAKLPDGRKWVSHGVPFTVDWDEANKDRIDCTAPWHHLFVMGKNRVRPCCMLKEGVIFPTNPQDHQADLWNNPGLLELRDALRSGDTRYCHPNCPAIQQWPAENNKTPLEPESYRRGDIIQQAPASIKLSLGSHCNHKCTFCKMGSALYNHWQQEDYAFEYLIRAISQVKTLTLTGGEPLVHFKRHHERLQRAFEQTTNLRVHLQTNGALIDKYMDVLKAIPDLALSVSMAGATREEYLALHRVDDFDKVCENLSALKKAREDKPTHIEIKMVYTKKNYKGIGSFAGLAHRIGADEIYFHHLMVLSKTDIDARDEIKPEDPEWQECLELFQDAKRSCDQYGVAMRVTSRDSKKVRQFNTKGLEPLEEDMEDFG